MYLSNDAKNPLNIRLTAPDHEEAPPAPKKTCSPKKKKKISTSPGKNQVLLKYNMSNNFSNASPIRKKVPEDGESEARTLRLWEARVETADEELRKLTADELRDHIFTSFRFFCPCGGYLEARSYSQWSLHLNTNGHRSTITFEFIFNHLTICFFRFRMLNTDH